MLLNRFKTLVFGACAVAAASLALAQDAQGEITATYTLPDMRIGEVQNAVLPDSIANDRGMLLGGIGSDLWRAAGDPEGEFWMITDRGPNGQIEVDGSNRRTFPIPEFTPHILNVRVAGDAIEVIQALPLVDLQGVPVTGLSNIDGHDEKPWDYAAAEALTFNPNGLDTEGIVRAQDGTFWLVDEYSPSLVHVNADGQVLSRFVPEGMDYTGATYEVVDNLPAVLASRRANRGFEGVAISPDGTTLFAAVQSPLRNPDADTGDNSAHARIISFDLASEIVNGEYVYSFQSPSEFEEGAEAGDLKISGLIALSNTELLVLERTDLVAKIYRADLTDATSIFNTAWDDAATAPSLEATADLASIEVVPAAKTLVVDLETIPGVPDKIEGIALVDSATLAIANDNDFNIGEFDADGNAIQGTLPSQILYITLPEAIQ